MHPAGATKRDVWQLHLRRARVPHRTCADMKRILRRLREKLLSKDLPPPYSVNDGNYENRQDELRNEVIPSPAPPVREVIDLLANCNITNSSEQFSEVEYAEIGDMGLWHSTPLPHRHKSKVSLTWVLKENIDNKFEKNEKILYTDNKSINKDRVVGRSEWTNRRFKSACDKFNGVYSCSDSSDETEYVRKKHRHRHRRKKRHPRFGYDIKDLDSFLSQASLDHPGNIPVVIAFPTTLYQTQKNLQRELPLPLGTVVNAVFKNQQWLYTQTPHGDEGYVLYSACLPLGILPSRTSLQKKTPCWESSTDIYPRPCGNLTDTEKEHLRGRTRSESSYKRRSRYKSSWAEKDFDTLYLKTKSVSNLTDNKENFRGVRNTLLVVNTDYIGSALNKTLTVFKGDVVTLVPGLTESDVDSEWFFVKKSDGTEGFIPADIVGHGFL